MDISSAYDGQNALGRVRVMPVSSRSTSLNYLIAIGVSLAAGLARWLLDPVLGPEVPFITFFLAVVVAGWYGGLGPAVLTAILGGVSAWFVFLPPHFSFAVERSADVVGMVVYFMVTLGIAALSGSMRDAQRRSRSAERRALRQREMMRITLASIGDAVITTDTKGTVTFLNATAADLCGWSAADARGKPLDAVFRIVNENTRAPVEDPVQAVLRRGHTIGLANHSVLIGKDGAEHPIDDSAAPIRDDQGHIAGVVLVFHDIAARRETEKRLRRSEEELEDFFENAAVALHWMGPDGTIVRVNQTELDMMGYAQEAYIGRRITDFHVDPEVGADILARLARGETVTNREAQLRCANGSIRTVVINANVLWEDGRFVHARCFTHDVTEQRDAEMKCRQLAAIVESSEDAIISKDLNGIITSWNRAAERLFGYRAEEMIGQSVTRLIPADQADEEPAILRRIRRGERVDHFETIRQRSDGRCIPVSLTISPIVSAEGRIIGVSKIARDITQQKRAEDALRDADRRKSEFLALLAHELRNPLASIRNSLEMLAITDAEKPPIAVMQRQLGQIVRLIDDLLDVNRISRGKVALQKERIDLAAVIEDAIEAARPTCDRAGHALVVSVPPRPILVHADRNRLVQVFGNLLDNACKFTPRGGRIWLTVTEDDGIAVIRVRDTGIGIAAEHMARIFEMFIQADTSLERLHGGLGLGLSVAKTLIEMHGGTIEGYSDGIGRGSEFVVRLPILNEEPLRTVARDSEIAAVPRRVLVVDDNRDSADSLAMLMEMSGHTVRTAYDGLEAVQAATEFQPEVILLDIGLPKLNGHDVARRIRLQPGGRGIFLIALTGWGQDCDRRQSEEAGFDAHLVKPLDYAALTKLLAEWVPAPVQEHAAIGSGRGGT